MNIAESVSLFRKKAKVAKQEFLTEWEGKTTGEKAKMAAIGTALGLLEPWVLGAWVSTYVATVDIEEENVTVPVPVPTPVTPVTPEPESIPQEEEEEEEETPTLVAVVNEVDEDDEPDMDMLLAISPEQLQRIGNPAA